MSHIVNLPLTCLFSFPILARSDETTLSKVPFIAHWESKKERKKQDSF